MFAKVNLKWIIGTGTQEVTIQLATKKVIHISKKNRDLHANPGYTC